MYGGRVTCAWMEGQILRPLVPGISEKVSCPCEGLNRHGQPPYKAMVDRVLTSA